MKARGSDADFQVKKSPAGSALEKSGDLEERIRRGGNPGLYTRQVNEGFATTSSTSRELSLLVGMLHRMQSAYEQEGYCLN